MDKPLLAFTLGDPAGVGPEIIVRAWTDPALHAVCRPFVIGRPRFVERAVTMLGGEQTVRQIDSPDQVVCGVDTIGCLSCGSAEAENAEPGKIDARGGQAAYDALIAAADLALARQVDGIVTAPLSKSALWAAGHHYPGHTELLAERCGISEVAMMLYLGRGPTVRPRAGLGVAHVTLHTALRNVFEAITPDNILSKARLADGVMRAMLGEEAKNDPPRIAVCALNPHAGEDGLFGDEELRIIGPAVEVARAAGLRIVGPIPADTLLMRAAGGEFDAVVAMYHDQGHIALKLLGMHRAVNITLGLPIVRTSVAHGTAFDLAWQGKAECAGLVEAARVAAQLVRARMDWG